MLKFNDDEAKQHFLNVMDFAMKNNSIENFITKIAFLVREGDRPKIQTLYDDINERNIYFVVTDKYSGERDYNGGIVYHEHSNEWGIHT